MIGFGDLHRPPDPSPQVTDGYSGDQQAGDEHDQRPQPKQQLLRPGTLQMTDKQNIATEAAMPSRATATERHATFAFPEPRSGRWGAVPPCTQVWLAIAAVFCSPLSRCIPSPSRDYRLCGQQTTVGSARSVQSWLRKRVFKGHDLVMPLEPPNIAGSAH